MLEGEPTANLGDLPLENIARGLQGIQSPQVSARYEEMKTVARHYLETLEKAPLAPEEKLAQYKERLASDLAPYADNPALPPPRTLTG